MSDIFIEGKDHPDCTRDAPSCEMCGNVIVRRRFACGKPKKHCSNKCTQLACRIRRAERQGKVYNVVGKVGRPQKTA